MVTKKWDKQADVVVVGCGGAGAAAAIEAHDAGSKVIVLESMDKAGGTTLVASGMVYGAGTSVQREHGIEDSAKEVLKLFKALAQGLAEEDKMTLMAEKSAEMIDWLMKQGVKFKEVVWGGPENLPEYTAITPPKLRAHMVPEYTGEGFMRPLMEAINKRKIEVLYNTAGKELIAEPATKEVLGVMTKTGLNIKAKRAVVLATGGFTRNEDMFRSYLTPYYKAVWPSTAEGNTGDGIKMGQALGADLVNMGFLGCLVDGTAMRPPSYSGEPAMGMLFIRLDRRWNCLAVDKNGKRFADDLLIYDRFCLKVMGLEGKFFWLMWDQSGMDKWGPAGILMPLLSPDFSKEMELGIIKKASTIRDMAGKIDIAPDVLEDTVNTYNENAKKGVDPEFGRTLHLMPLDKPPYYASKCGLTLADTEGGLKADSNYRVLDVFGKRIPRLYVAGTTMGGYIGQWYAGGMFLCHVFVSGRIAGQNAAKETPRA